MKTNSESTLKSTIRLVLVLLFPAVLSMGLVGCDNDGPMEEAGEEIDQAVDDAGDAIEDAADEIEDEID